MAFIELAQINDINEVTPSLICVAIKSKSTWLLLNWPSCSMPFTNRDLLLRAPNA